MLGAHSFGLYEKALPAGLNWQQRLQATKGLGFDFLEISIDESEERLGRLYAPSAGSVLREAVQSSKIPISSMCLSAHRRFPFGSSDASVRERAWDILVRAVDLAQSVGISIIQIAAYDVYYEPSTEASRARFAEALAKALRIAEQAGVILANETMDTPFLNSITKHLALAEKIGNPWLKVYPDVGNLSAWGNNVLDELRKGICSIAQVHLKDTLAVTENFGGQFRDVPFGCGCVDFPLCFSILDQLGYTGGYLMEMWSRPGEEALIRIKEGKEFLEKQYARSRQGGEA